MELVAKALLEREKLEGDEFKTLLETGSLPAEDGEQESEAAQPSEAAQEGEAVQPTEAEQAAAPETPQEAPKQDEE